MKNKTKFYLFSAIVIMLIFFSIKTVVVFEVIPPERWTRIFEYLCFIFFTFVFYPLAKEFILKNKNTKKEYETIRNLNKVLVEQSHNQLLYDGDIFYVAKELTLKVSESLEADRCSIWLYNENKDSIICEQLYVRKDKKWLQGIELFKKDYLPYFNAISETPIIVANDAEAHSATSCFTESYLKPLGIKSMLDVPIIFEDNVIGVICIENLSKREWKDSEIDFAQTLSSLYSFAYSVKKNNSLKFEKIESDNFLDEAVIISRADKNGKIIYVNKKFEDVSGWSLSEVIGRDHNIVNSGFHTKDFWVEMYKTVLKEKKIWNGVITNRTKDGDLYYVDSYIKALFNDNGEHTGFLSIRQDVSEIAKVNEKLNGLVSSQTSYVLRTDMEGRHTYWNQKFEDEFGWVYEGNIMHSDSLLSICESHHDAARKAVMECISEPGKIVKVELDKPHKDGNKRTTLWEFVCLTDRVGTPLEVQCMGIDITERVMTEKKIIEVLNEVEKKNVYLEHAAKILRHDMHSGINTYIPRGVTSLERRLSPDQQKELKIESPMRMIKEGLLHTQKVYKGVYEFTNLVKPGATLTKTKCNLKNILSTYLSTTAYVSQVSIDELIETEVNESLFCTAIDNLIRNGLKYNDSDTKLVKLYMENGDLIIQDNGRGMTQDDFENFSKPYTRKEGQKESGTGLGLNICNAILKEHGFIVNCEKNNIGTKIKIKLK